MSFKTTWRTASRTRLVCSRSCALASTLQSFRQACVRLTSSKPDVRAAAGPVARRDLLQDGSRPVYAADDVRRPEWAILPMSDLRQKGTITCSSLSGLGAAVRLVGPAAAILAGRA